MTAKQDLTLSITNIRLAERFRCVMVALKKNDGRLSRKMHTMRHQGSVYFVHRVEFLNRFN